MGVFPVLPLYASSLGATSGMVGVYLADLRLDHSGHHADRLAGETLSLPAVLAAAGLLGMPALVLMGQVGAMWQLIILTGIVWFAGGIGLSLLSVMTGMITDPQRRGKSFGLMSLSLPLGALAGGMTVGQLIDWSGYATMFAVLGALWIVIPLSAWGLDPAKLKPGAQESDQDDNVPAEFGRGVLRVHRGDAALDHRGEYRAVGYVAVDARARLFAQ